MTKNIELCGCTYKLSKYKDTFELRNEKGVIERFNAPNFACAVAYAEEYLLKDGEFKNG